MVYEDALNLYTDGSSLSSPRRGGMAVRFVWVNDAGDEVAEQEVLQGYLQATNNEMELSACIEALRLARKHPRVDAVNRIVVFTDSKYVQGNVQLAKFRWPRQRWLNTHGRPIESADLWKELVREIKKSSKRIDFEWVKGHSKDLHNRAVDKAAKASAKGLLKTPRRPVNVRRKRTSQTVQVGCVAMKGQVLSIRVIVDKYLKVQRLFKYKYEVLPGDPEHSEKVDWIYSDLCLGAGHHYEIRVNSDSNNPRIVEMIRELERAST